MEDLELRNKYLDIFDEIINFTDDFDTLRIGTEIIKIAMQRLDKDLGNEEIKTEYNKLGNICNELDNIIKNYV